MEDVDVELGNLDIIQNPVVQSLLDCVGNETNRTKQLPRSIYMLPSVCRDRSPSSFNPQVVSIGPLHREDEKLQNFERSKASYVHDLFLRLNLPPEQTLQACVHKVNNSIDLIRECYVGIKTYSDVELSKMMVMDGCFIIEFINIFCGDELVVKDILLRQAISYDLLLLENQIPFFVLSDIFQCTLVKSGFEASLISFIFSYLRHFRFLKVKLELGNIDIDATSPVHILGLYHECYRPRGNMEFTPFSAFSSSTAHCALELDRAGVNFEPYRDANWQLAMEVKSHRFQCLSWYWAKPTLRMPVFYLHDNTELLLRNLMAYEQSSLGCNFVTSYVIAMEMLVNTQEDVAMLVKSKVLINSLGSDDEVVNLMNNVCKEIAWLDFHYTDQWNILDSYYNGYWPRQAAWLRRTYFGSPWSFIALVGGIVLFGLTVVQTIIAITGPVC